MNYEHIVYENKHGISVLRLNRQEVLNSFNRQMALEMQRALDMIESDSSVRAVYITGMGKAFCAGQDLAEAISGAISVGDIVIEHYNPIIKKIRTIAKPFIAGVNGVAAGAGANLALACDFVVASDKASFIQSFSNIGLIPDSGGTFMLPRLVGMARAASLIMLGEKVSAESAYNMGMIYKYVQHDELEGAALGLAESLAEKPTLGLGLAKEALNNTYNNNLFDQLELEAVLQIRAGDSYDYKEGVNAFLEKRKPVFRGE